MKTLTGVVGLIRRDRRHATRSRHRIWSSSMPGFRRHGVIERGSVVVRGGKIVSAEAGTAAASGMQRSMPRAGRLMPGFIDAHRHIAEGNPGMAGETRTRADAGVPRRRLHHRAVRDSSRPRVELRHGLSRGGEGPRLLVGTSIPLAPSRCPRRSSRRRWPRRRSSAIRQLAAAAARTDGSVERSRPPIRSRRSNRLPAGATISSRPSSPPHPAVPIDTLADRQRGKRNLPTITHVVSVIDTLAAVEAHPDVLVHAAHLVMSQTTPTQSRDCQRAFR